MNNVLGVAGGCAMGFTKAAFSYELLILGRFLIGINCGKVNSTKPVRYRKSL